MVVISRTSPSWLTQNRLDTYYYDPKFIHHITNVRSKFKTMISFGDIFDILDGTHDSVETSKIQDRIFNIPFLRAQDIGCCHLNNVNGAFIREEDHQKKCKRSQIKHGDILLNIMATTGEACLYDEIYPSEINANRAVGILREKNTNRTDINKRFICVLLSSKVGNLELARNLKGSIQQRLNLEDIANCQIPLIDRLVQNYIGDKVRLAEKLRERSKELEIQAKKLFENKLFWDRQLETKKIHGRVEFKDLEQRLDINFNSPNRLSLLQHLRKNDINTEPLADLVEISAMIGWKGLTTEHYTNEGPWLLRGVEFSNGVIDFDSLVSIKKFKYDEQPQIHLKEGDIAFTKDGTIGKAIVIPHLSSDLAAGSTVARLRLSSENKIDLYYLEYALNHPVVQIQIMSFATGMAQPHITQEWIAKLQIPRCIAEEEIGNKIKSHHECLIESDNLTTAAKYLVEALIEGKLTETEIKNAQIALQKGDIELDKAILAKLTRKGYDISDEPPLFPDLDALYQATRGINLTSE